MNVVCFSSFTFAYLNRARVLFQSLRRIHPDWTLVALITDQPPEGYEFEPADEDFDQLIYSQDLGIEDWRCWLFQHDIVEVCTAVKGSFMRNACRSGADVVIYLDPDTCVFNTLDPVLDHLQTHEIVLTPHQLTPDDTHEAIIDNEICSLKTGIYNLGFIAIRTTGEGQRFADWWADRLLMFCHDDIPSGLFVDQRWCDHVPSFFENVHILRDPGYNVASWNLSRRKIAFDEDGAARVNGALLRFWHFTKLGPLGDVMTRRYAAGNYQVHEIWNWYRSKVAEMTEADIPRGYWKWGVYEDGKPVEREHRLLYRSRLDLRKSFVDPFISGSGSYQEWLADNGYAA